MTARRVAVVGAGPSGLTTVKALLEEGHTPVCFERAPDLGGVFRFDEHEGVVWESCRLTSSGLITAFSDFPVGPAQTGHLPIGDYVAYLRAYAEAFGVTPHLRFGCRVEAATRTDAGWVVSWTDVAGRHHDVFDAVVACSGRLERPHVPTLAGLGQFRGHVMHASQYRRPSQIAGKRVLVVGGGESGADLVAEVAEHARETRLSLRRGVAVQRRITFGHPGDYRISRVGHSPAHWIAHSRHAADRGKRRLYRWAFLPLVVVDKALQIVHRLGWEWPPLLRGGTLSDLRTNVRTRRLMKRLVAESGGSVPEQFGTKTDEFVRAIARGRARRVGAVAGIEAGEVVFEAGERWTPDVIILGTGFETGVSWLSPSIAHAPRFLHTFEPATGPTLAFIGYVRPGFGAVPPLAELQARWLALVLSGARQLPSCEEMRRRIAEWEDLRARLHRPLASRLPQLVDFTYYCDALASEVGCKPTRAAIAAEPRAFRRRFYGAPFVSAQYRLVGPHANPELARATITKLPIVHPGPELLNLYLRWTLSRVLHRLLGHAYAPKLALK